MRTRFTAIAVVAPDPRLRVVVPTAAKVPSGRARGLLGIDALTA